MADNDVCVVVNDLQNKLESVPVENLKPIIVGGFKEEAILIARDVENPPPILESRLLVN